MDRTPKNMQELLKFAIKQQQNSKTECVEIDEDKKIFLDHVLQSMSVNVMEEFLKAIRILQDDQASDEEMIDALDLVRNYIDNIDFANSFAKIEGADILLKCIRHKNQSICANALSIVAEMSQNNIFCQQYFLKYDIIEQLIIYLKNEDAELVASSLYALSALIRNYEPGLMEFIKKGGPRHVYNCLSVESPRVFSKTCFLMTSISSEFSLIRDEFVKLGVLSKVSNKLHIINGYEVEMEMILNVLSVLLGSRYCSLTEDENRYIAGILRDIVVKNGHLEECEEIVTCSKAILQELESREEANIININ